MLRKFQKVGRRCWAEDINSAYSLLSRQLEETANLEGGEAY